MLNKPRPNVLRHLPLLIAVVGSQIIAAATTAAPQTPNKLPKVVEKPVKFERTLTVGEEELVRDSRRAIVRSGISESYFSKHFTLYEVRNLSGDNRVIWRFSLNEYATNVVDAIGFYTEGSVRKQTHSVSSTLPLMTEIQKTISRRRAEQLLRACIGRFQDAAVEFRPVGKSGTAKLFLTASAPPRVVERQEQERTAKKRQASSMPEQGPPARDETGEEEETEEKRPPTILGAIDLQTGKCTKGRGYAGPRRLPE